MDRRKFNGGHSNGGRKPKAEEQKLIEKLSPLEESAHKALKDNIEKGEPWAIKMYFEYMYGKPRQTIDQNNNHSGDISISPKEWL